MRYTHYRAHFEWFCEEDEPIDAYCARLRKAGEWGGNMEVVAASGHWKIGIAIVSDSDVKAAQEGRIITRLTRASLGQHQADTPCYVVCEDDVRSGSRGGGRKTLHLSLHDGASDGFAHYNSVRMMSEGDDGPSRISIQGVQGDGDSLQHEDALASDAANVTVVMRGSGCTDELRAKQMLASLDGDVDAAIEAIIAGCELGPQTDEPRGQGDAERAGEGDGHRQAGDDEDPASPGREDDGSDAGAGGGSGSGEGGGGVATGHVKTKMQQKREAKAAKAAAKRAEKRERVLGRGTPDPDKIPPPSEADHLRAGGHTLANGIRVLSI